MAAGNGRRVLDHVLEIVRHPRGLDVVWCRRRDDCADGESCRPSVDQTIRQVEFHAPVRRRVAAVLNTVAELVVRPRRDRPVQPARRDPPRRVKHVLNRNVWERPLAPPVIVLTVEIPAGHPRQIGRHLKIDAACRVVVDLLARLQPREILRPQTVRAEQRAELLRLVLFCQQGRDGGIRRGLEPVLCRNLKQIRRPLLAGRRRIPEESVCLPHLKFINGRCRDVLLLEVHKSEQLLPEFSRRHQRTAEAAAVFMNAVDRLGQPPRRVGVAVRVQSIVPLL